ncbi:hypothetical protein DV959_13930 [Staphylococcus pseudintermedius]|nr:hypothetical protein DV959_13930 [Staphylococcus pseudintermedius]
MVIGPHGPYFQSMKEIAMTTSKTSAPAPTIPTDAGTAALAYYRRETVKPAAQPVAANADSSDLDQMFGYYAA